MLVHFALIAVLAHPQPSDHQPSAPPPPEVAVAEDGTAITGSCLVRIPADKVIADSDGDGVIHIGADGITVEFEDKTILRGAPAGTPGDQLKGVGIRLDGHKNVVLKNVRVSGFKVGILASNCPGLIVENADLSENYRQHLKSTAAAEDGADWLYPHNNDEDQWVTQHGAALAVKNASNVTIRKVKIRDGQNGIILHRVTDSRVYDDDCSFLSGWGIAMWRSSRNLICRNALDFCIRGYSHGVYNRGQDSAGLLMFEQCSENLIAQNSITHGGDGIFGFAGREAIGETPAPSPDFDYKLSGCNDNLIAENDLSSAAAHGLEMTFSHGNKVVGNKLNDNGICGIWGGYSQEMLIAENEIEGNGQMAYGLEGGGINIEHGSRNLIVSNRFRRNACAVHLWWDDDGDLLKKPGVAAAGSDVEGNTISSNTFTGEVIALQLRDSAKPPTHVRNTVFAKNTFEKVGKELVTEEGISVTREGEAPMYVLPKYELVGETHPVGARASLAGRENIVMTEWGPWDHEGPLVRLVSSSGPTHHYQLFNLPKDATVTVTMADGRPSNQVVATHWVRTSNPQQYDIAIRQGGVAAYSLLVEAGPYQQKLEAAFVKTMWQVALFPWEGSLNPPKPPENLEAWRALAIGPKAAHAKTMELSFKFGTTGPTAITWLPEFAKSGLPGSLYGLIATTVVPIQKGKWTIKTTSDDGIRVIVDGKPIIENWTHHAPAVDTGQFEVSEARSVPITVEYFQIGGFAVLDFQIEPAK
jgi:parallel beta-helix repeat protein